MSINIYNQQYVSLLFKQNVAPAPTLLVMSHRHEWPPSCLAEAPGFHAHTKQETLRQRRNDKEIKFTFLWNIKFQI